MSGQAQKRGLYLLFFLLFALPKVCGAVPSHGIGPNCSNHGVSAGSFGHRWQKMPLGGREKRECDQFLSLENQYWIPGKCSMKLVVPAVWGLPRAAVSITTLSGFCLWSCTKRTFPCVHRIPFLMPWFPSSSCSKRGPLEKQGAGECWVQQHPWSCSAEVAHCSSWLGFLGKATFLPLACAHRASPQRRQQGLGHTSTGTHADPPKDAPSLSVTRIAFN